MLAATGCIWACPYSTIVLDFSCPLQPQPPEHWLDLRHIVDPDDTRFDDIEFVRRESDSLLLRGCGTEDGRWKEVRVPVEQLRANYKCVKEGGNMEKKDFPKGTKPREIFVYTCERIAEPLTPLGYKYRKSKNDIYKKDGIFVFSFYFSPSIRFGSTTFTAFFDVSSPVIAQWRSEQEGTEETYDGIVGTSIARLTHRYDDFPRYEVSTLLERERSIQEISGQIQDYALPFFARFSDLPKLLDDVEREGFFPHRKGFDVPKRNREFIECFREYLQKQQANGLSY